MIYLANSYTHPDLLVLDERFKIACRLATRLNELGYLTYSPIVATVALQRYGGAEGTWKYWAEYDKEFVRRCDEVWVAVYAGWEESVGVQAEIEWATELGKPIRYIDPEEYGVDLSLHDRLLYEAKAAA